MISVINNILIANRGEIALRIIRTVRKLGLSATGIYSDSDMVSPWIAQCDQAWPLGEGKLSDTYLNIGKIIDIARQSGADAIHPGYGFLSENYRLAEACEKHNIIFIGPSSDILKIAADKSISNELANSLDIPVTPKLTGNIDKMMTLLSEMGFPVLAKAVAGGGGKGIRLVQSPKELNQVLKTVSAEAFNYFGDERVFFEKYIADPRHLEVQIIGDTHGHLIHLYERECSVQRRHQKLIEECPASGLNETVRHLIIQDALKIAHHLGYTSAGTIEFLLDRDDNYYFLEINPRIQVEHGITEMVTGIDIVKEQINIAQGGKLSFDQSDIVIRGHAIEARVYSEDPVKNMVPAPGKIHFMSVPRDVSLRIDTGSASGSEILPDFDPLILKIMVHAGSRNEALPVMKQALDETIITGVLHNISLIDLIISDSDFIQNSISTTWLENKYQFFSDKLAEVQVSINSASLCITAALLIFNKSLSGGSGYWRNVRQIRFRITGRLIEMEYESIGDSVTFYYQNDIFHVSSVYCDDFRISYLVNGKNESWYYVPEKEGFIVISDGHSAFYAERFILKNKEYDATAEPDKDAENTVLAPQPGTIVEIKVSEGQQVSRGDYLLTIESMKLENTVMAVSAGIIKKIIIKTGDKVRKNEPLIHLEQIITN